MFWRNLVQHLLRHQINIVFSICIAAAFPSLLQASNQVPSPPVALQNPKVDHLAAVQTSAADAQKLELNAHEEWEKALATADGLRVKGDEDGDNVGLEKSIAYYRDVVLPLAPRKSMPIEWALTQNSLGAALRVLGERKNETARLEEAVTAFSAALTEFSRENTPLEWAYAQYNLGDALSVLGESESGTAHLKEAVTAYQSSLLERTRERAPLEWAEAQENICYTLGVIGNREKSVAKLEEAITACRASLLERTRDRFPLEWADTQNNLCNMIGTVGALDSSVAKLNEAITACGNALVERQRERDPLRWAATQTNLGNAFISAGILERGTSRLEEAVAALQAAQLEFTQERTPVEWLQASLSSAMARAMIAERNSRLDLIPAIRSEVNKAKQVAVEENNAAMVELADIILAQTNYPKGK